MSNYDYHIRGAEEALAIIEERNHCSICSDCSLNRGEWRCGYLYDQAVKYMQHLIEIPARFEIVAITDAHGKYIATVCDHVNDCYTKLCITADNAEKVFATLSDDCIVPRGF